MKMTITRFRDKRSSIAVGFSSKDRVSSSRKTVERLLDQDGIDLFWFDGSTTPEGRDLPGQLMPGRPAAVAMHHGVVGGPDSAILYALMTLREAGYGWIVLIENDVLLEEGWLDALFSAVEAAERDGFRVGGASCRVMAERVLSFNGTYSLLFNAGAGFIALTREGVDHVIRNYRTLDTAELVRRLLDLTGVDVSRWWAAGGDERGTLLLCADWMFDLALYSHGLVVAAPPVTFARHMDHGNEAAFVTLADQHPEGARGALVRGADLRRVVMPNVRFGRWRGSDRVLVGVQHLRLGRPEDGVKDGATNGADSPVIVSGDWARRWLQFCGPFELFGTGSLSVELFDAPLSLVLHARQGKAVVEVTASGTTALVEIDPAPTPLPLAELSLETVGPRRGRVTVSVRSGAVGVVGLAMAPELTPYFANPAPDAGFLAW